MDYCRNLECREIPTIHVEINRYGEGSGKKALQWEGNFCREHLGFPLLWQIEHMAQNDILIVETWKVKRHGSSGEQGQERGAGGVHEGAGDPASNG